MNIKKIYLCEVMPGRVQMGAVCANDILYLEQHGNNTRVHCKESLECT